MELIEQVQDILNKWEFFYGQRAGRELWSEKPTEVQEKDIENFCQDLAMVRSFVGDINVGHWISVSKRLPEDDLPKDSKKKVIKCLIAYKTSMGVWVVRTNTRQKGRWYNDKGWDWAVSDPITHWMPLPEPPATVSTKSE